MYSCICIFHCSDEDECRRSLPPCVPIAQCVNTPGSYRCECPAGYRLHQNGHNCQGKTRSPASSSVCSWLIRMNSCQVIGEYSVYYTFVVDIDECTMFPGICANGFCTNLEGRFRCLCNQGYRLNRNKDACIGTSYIIVIKLLPLSSYI